MTTNEYPVDIGFMITKAPLESGLVSNALKIAQGALDQGKKVALFLISDGVWLVKKGQKNNVAELFGKLLSEGVQVTASEVHLAAAGINEKDIQDGVTVTKKSYKDLVLQVMEQWRKVVSI